MPNLMRYGFLICKINVFCNKSTITRYPSYVFSIFIKFNF